MIAWTAVNCVLFFQSFFNYNNNPAFSISRAILGISLPVV